MEMGALRIAAVLGGEAWEGECSGGSEVKTLVNGFSPWGFVLLSAIGDTRAPAPSLSVVTSPWHCVPSHAILGHHRGAGDKQVSLADM